MVGSSDGKRTGEGRDGGTRLASNMLASIDGKTPRRTCLADQLREQAGPQTSRNKHPFVVSKSAPDTRRFRRGCLTTGYHEEERDALTEPRTRFQVFSADSNTQEKSISYEGREESARAASCSVTTSTQGCE